MASLKARAWLSLVILDVIIAVVLFGFAGTLRWWQGWVYLVLMGGLVLLSIFVPPDLGPPANLSQGGNQPVQAPWFFLAIQWLLRYVPPLWGGWLIPLMGLILLVALPLLDRRGPGRGRWFARERWQPQAAFAGLLFLIVVLSLLELWQIG